ncbi:MAG: TIGR00153 family protein [Nitrospinales bacterium]
MRSILSMFAESPFKPLTGHIDKVRACVNLIKPLFKAQEEMDYKKVLSISENIMKFEHDADIIKDKIRSQIPKSIFLPVDKRDFDHLLSVQDDMADAVEDLAVLLRIKNLVTPEPLIKDLNALVDHVVKSALKSCDLICELETLLEASFGGKEAEYVERGSRDLAHAEWESDKIQFTLAQKLFSLEEPLSAADLLLWNEVNKKLGGVSDKAEQIGKVLLIFISK